MRCVRAEPELAFRIAGKVSKRLVEGQRVKAEQPAGRAGPAGRTLPLEANRAQLAAAEANLSLVRTERRYQKLLDRQMVGHSQYCDNAENLYRTGLAPEAGQGAVRRGRELSGLCRTL